MLFARIAPKTVSNRWAYVLLGTLLGTLLSLAFLAKSAQGITEERVDRDPQGAPYVAGELLVTYATDEEAPAATAEGVVEEVDAEVKEEIPALDAQLVEFPEVKEEPSRGSREDLLEQKREELAQEPAVESVSFNYVFEAARAPNDPRFKDQYGLSRPGFTWAWGKVRGNGVNIAVLDTGVAASHPDLQGKVTEQKNFVGDTESDNAADDNGHGTLVAGVAAALTDNGVGVAGACPECGLLAVKVLRANEMGTASDIAEGIVWATDSGAEVINLSLSSQGDPDVVRRAVNYAWNNGSVLVAAAGNQDSSVREYPAAYPNAIAVAATNQRDNRASFSNYGGWIDVVAPGVGILSTKRPTGYGVGSGTSYSAPYVAALAGLLAEEGRSPSEIRGTIERTALDLGPRGKDRFYGHGRIDAAAAVGVKRPKPNTAPRISALKPRPGSKIKNRRPTISATVRDSETDLKRSHISLTVDKKSIKKGFRYDRKRERLTYTPRNKLAPGRHSVRIVARDEQGRKTTKSWTFRVEVRKQASNPALKRNPYGQGFPFRHLPKGYPFNVIR